MEMYFHGNQPSWDWGTKCPVISLYSWYHSSGFTCYIHLACPLISSLDGISPSLFSCGHATLWEALPVHPSIGPLVRRSVLRGDRVKKWKMSVLDTFYVCLCMEVGVGCPCPPIRNDIVTLRHLFTQNCLIKMRELSFLSISFKFSVQP